MAYVFANDIGGFQGAREREQGRFDVLARQAAADQERAIASANEADRFAFQAAARDAQLMEDRNRFQLQQALQERDREERRGDVLFNRRLMLGQEGREQDRFKLARERFETERKLAEDDARLMGLEDESIGSSIAGSLAAAEESLSAQQAAFKRAQDALTQSKGKLAAAGFTFRGDNFVRPNLSPMLPEAERKKLVEAQAALEQNYFDAVAARADADREFKIALQNASQVRTSAIRNQMFPGQGVVTSGRTGKKYSFGPQMGGPAASGGLDMQNVTQVGWVGPQGRELANPFRVPGATPPPVARQTDEEFGPPETVSPQPARPPEAQGRPSPTYRTQEMQGAPSASEIVSAKARQLLSPEQQFQANRFALLDYFRQLGLNPYSEPLRIGSSSLFRSPIEYMQEFQKTPEFRAWYDNLDDSLKARIAESAAISALGRSKGSPGVERRPYAPNSNFNWRRSDFSEPVYE